MKVKDLREDLCLTDEEDEAFSRLIDLSDDEEITRTEIEEAEIADTGEAADSMVDIYNKELWDWARDNTSYVEDAIREFGADSVKDRGLEHLFQMGQYLYWQEQLSAVQTKIEEWLKENPEESDAKK